MNLARKAIILTNLEMAEQTLDRIVEDGMGLDLSQVKRREYLEPKMPEGLIFSTATPDGFSTVARLAWLPTNDDELGVSVFFLLESAMCVTPVDPATLTAALSFNHGLRAPWKVASVGQGRYLGVDAVVDLYHLSRDEIPAVICSCLEAAGQVFNYLSTRAPELESLGATFRRLRSATGQSH